MHEQSTCIGWEMIKIQSDRAVHLLCLLDCRNLTQQWLATLQTCKRMRATVLESSSAIRRSKMSLVTFGAGQQSQRENVFTHHQFHILFVTPGLGEVHTAKRHATRLPGICHAGERQGPAANTLLHYIARRDNSALTILSCASHWTCKLGGSTNFNFWGGPQAPYNRNRLH